MRFRDLGIGFAVAVAAFTLSGCGTPDPLRYAELSSSGQLAPNPHDESGRIPYRYATQVNWRGYDRIIIAPVEIYRGADHQFGKMTEEDKHALADYMKFKFAEKLQPRFALTDQPSPSALRLKLTLTGAAANTAVVSTFTKFDLAGGLYNGVQAIRGGEGMMGGAVMYVVELYDSTSGRLLESYVTKQYPNAMNIGASIGSLAAAKTGIEKGAEALAAELD